MISEKSYEVHEGNGNDIIERLLDSRGETAEDVKDAPMHSPWLIDGMEQVINPGDVVTMAAGCRHTVIAETELTILEAQLGENISVSDKKKYELPV